MKTTSLIRIILLALVLGQFTSCQHCGTCVTADTMNTRLVGYGVVNHWFKVDSNAFARALRERDLNCTEIEYVPWFDASGREGLSDKTDVEAARRFVQAMRAQRVTTFVSVVNWNGEAQRQQSDDWYRARVVEIRERIGQECVILLPVSEPDPNDSKCMRWQEIAKAEWPGILAANGPFGRGDALFSGATFNDWHWCDDFDATNVRPRPFINNTDCRPVLNPGPERAAAMAKIAEAANAHFIIYDWDGESVDESVLNALRPSES